MTGQENVTIKYRWLHGQVWLYHIIIATIEPVDMIYHL